ncbi:hypothetical protein [Radiobacillus sp. PE A8.2]|uniref:hypothetical protein n=1 Tax=Radiobacillus sp. PE A8.2 TaxID=3380349 RepID=UPI00388D7C51
MGVYYFYSDYIYNEGTWRSSYVSVEGEKFVRNINRKKSAWEMDVSSFWIGPGKVYVDVEEPLYDLVDIEHTGKKYMYRGCTLLISQFPIKHSLHYKQPFINFKKKLSSLSIDYMVVPRIPLSVLRTEHIRYFGRVKVPFIIVEARSIDEMLQIKWEWMEAAQSFSGIPIVCTHAPSRKPQKEVIEVWENICDYYKIHTLNEPITEFPLSNESLRLAGISPFKGEYFHQGYADYNLFQFEKSPIIDEHSKFRYHKAIPIVTVSKGQVIKSSNLIELEEEVQGSYRKISIPRHFLPS